MKKVIILFLFVIIILGVVLGEAKYSLSRESNDDMSAYWLILHRKSNIEYLYKGVFGEKHKSMLINIFGVKSGIPGEKPTPLPQLLGRDYWIVTDKMSVDASENPETAPYFLTLDVPVTEAEPYGPVPYNECNGQCDWILPGYFGLHGVNGDESRLSDDNPGSSGCVRHRDEDITYLYNILNPKTEEIRYYIEDI